MCGRDRSDLALLSYHRLKRRCQDQPTPVKARALRARLRRLTALTGIVCPGV